jgi:RNA recognition motif-containing protein
MIWQMYPSLFHPDTLKEPLKNLLHGTLKFSLFISSILMFRKVLFNSVIKAGFVHPLTTVLRLRSGRLFSTSAPKALPGLFGRGNRFEETNISISPTWYKRGQSVRIHILSIGTIGAKVMIEGPGTKDAWAHGLVRVQELGLYETLKNCEVKEKDVLEGFVLRCKDDGKVDVGLLPNEDHCTTVLNAIRSSPDGSIPIGDQSSADDIYNHLKVPISKSQFKRTIGSLFKQGFVIPGKTLTRLDTRTKEEKEAALEAARGKGAQRAGASDAEKEKTKSFKELRAKRAEKLAETLDDCGDELDDVLSNSTSKNDKFKDKDTAAPYIRDDTATIYVGNLLPTVQPRDFKIAVEKLLVPSNIASLRVSMDKATGKNRGYAYVEMQSDQLVEQAMEVLKQLKLDGRSIRLDYCDIRKRKYVEKKRVPAGDTSLEQLSENLAAIESDSDKFRRNRNVLGSGPDRVDRHTSSPSSAVVAVTRGGRYSRRNREEIAAADSVKSAAVRRCSLYVGNLDYSVDQRELMAEMKKFVPPSGIKEVRFMTDKISGKSRGFAYVDCTSKAAAAEVSISCCF